MFVRASALSLALSFTIQNVVGLSLDVNSEDSIKATAKTLASNIVSFYNTTLTKDLIPGLFGDDYYWWEAGTVWNALISYSYLTGDSSYNSIISEALQHQSGDYNAFMPRNQTASLGNDDQSTWGLAALTAAEIGFPKPQQGEWLDKAIMVFDTQVLRWDNATCGGGLRWQLFTFNNGYDYKNSVTNANFFLLSARLARLTGNSTYAEWAGKSYNWAKEIGLVVDRDGKGTVVYDGTSTMKNCSDLNHIQWSSDLGTYLEGAAVMYNLTNGAQNWTQVVSSLANTTSNFVKDGQNIIIETACENRGNCDTSMRAMKGVAVRSIARAAAVASGSISNSLFELIQKSAQGAASACVGESDAVKCGFSWADSNSKWEKASASDGNLGEVFDALEVIQGLLYRNKASVVASGANGNQNTTLSKNTGNATSGAASQQKTGAADTIAASGVFALAVAFAAALIL